jgi:hypothetical protein
MNKFDQPLINQQKFPPFPQHDQLQVQVMVLEEEVVRHNGYPLNWTNLMMMMKKRMSTMKHSSYSNQKNLLKFEDKKL